MNSIHPLLDADKQIRARAYETKKRRLSFWNDLSGYILMILFILFISPLLLNHLSYPNPIKFLLYLWSLAIFSFPVELLFSYLSGYKIEHEFGFSNQNHRQFFGEQAKGFLLNLAINPIVALILFLAFNLSQDLWWLWAALGMIFISVVFATLYPVIIMPIFNKYTPIDNPELTDKLGAILKKGGLKIKGFFLQDMSRQTKRKMPF